MQSQEANIEFSKRGGAKIGNLNATWPLAKLTVNKYKLELNASLVSVVFKPGDITSIEPYGFGLISGIRINHKVEKYKSLVVFRTSDNATQLISDIRKTGFFDNNDALPDDVAASISVAQTGGAFPIKTSAAIITVLIWNLLCLPSFISAFWGNKVTAINLSPNWALGFVLLLSVGLLTIPSVQRLILKPGRDIQSIRVFLFFLIFIVGTMLIMRSLLPMSQR